MKTKQLGDLVQIRKGITGAGGVGVVIGECVGTFLPDCDDGDGVMSDVSTVTLNQVLFADGVRDVHPSNLQKPDGRTRRRP